MPIVPARNIGFEFARAGFIDPRLSFNRLGVATYQGAGGALVDAQPNEPRIWHDPMTRARRGLLLEGSHQTLLVRSEEFDSASWTKSASSVTANAATGPRGDLVADKLTEDGATARHYIRQSVTVTAGLIYCLSVYVKADAARRLRIRLPLAQFSGNCYADIDPATGSVTTGTTAIRGGAVYAGDGWWRVMLVGTATVTAAANIEIELLSAAGTSNYAGDGVSGLLIWGANLTPSANLASYIPTSSATVTRAADGITLPWRQFGVDPSAGTLLAEWRVPHGYYAQAAARTYSVASLSDGTVNNQIAIEVAAGGVPTAKIVTAGVTQVEISGTALPLNDTTRAIFAWSSVGASAAFASGIASASVGALPAGLTTARIGTGPAAASDSYLDGYFRRLIYWPGRITDDELQAMVAA